MWLQHLSFSGRLKAKKAKEALQAAELKVIMVVSLCGTIIVNQRIGIC